MSVCKLVAGIAPGRGAYLWAVWQSLVLFCRFFSSLLVSYETTRRTGYWITITNVFATLCDWSSRQLRLLRTLVLSILLATVNMLYLITILFSIALLDTAFALEWLHLGTRDVLRLWMHLVWSLGITGETLAAGSLSPTFTGPTSERRVQTFWRCSSSTELRSRKRFYY